MFWALTTKQATLKTMIKVYYYLSWNPPSITCTLAYWREVKQFERKSLNAFICFMIIVLWQDHFRRFDNLWLNFQTTFSFLFTPVSFSLRDRNHKFLLFCLSVYHRVLFSHVPFSSNTLLTLPGTLSSYASVLAS